MGEPTKHVVYEATHRLEARRVFDSLAEDEARDGKRYRAYAHHLARACWHGIRIMLRQTSPEAEGIFDFILELHKACDGHWDILIDDLVTQDDLDAWLEYSAMFLSSVGNYYNDGDRKAVPRLSKEALQRMASISPEATDGLGKILDQMLAPQPSMLGYPGNISQSGYYIGDLTRDEIEAITIMMEVKKIAPENTRLRKAASSNSSGSLYGGVFEILQASAEEDSTPVFLADVEIDGQRPGQVFLRRGDHSVEMAKICAEFIEAQKLASTVEQTVSLSQLVETFRTGNYKAFEAAQKTWVTDKAPRVEHCMGFLFGYRDPHGVRAEWQAASGVAHAEETTKMGKLVGMSTGIIRTLPWAVAGENDGKGPFEPSELEAPDFAVIHVLASVSSTVWEATNITLDNDKGGRHGVKNMVYGNRMDLNSSPGRPCYYIDPSEAEDYMSCAHIIRFVGTAVHELIGHGTGKLLSETTPGDYNFDHKNPPMSPVNGKAIETWYRPGQTYNGVFGHLACTVEECRAFLMTSYLADNQDILSLFGYDENSTPTADEFLYYTYLRIGDEGIRALHSFKAEDQTWGGDHDRANFVIFKHLLQDGEGVLQIQHDPEAKTLFVHVDRSKIISHGKPSIGRLLTKIHIWHSTGDIDGCRPLYEALSAVDGDYETWRQLVVSKPEPKWKFVQPNTFLLEDGSVELREYEANNAGIIRSFFERNI